MPQAAFLRFQGLLPPKTGPAPPGSGFVYPRTGAGVLTDSCGKGSSAKQPHETKAPVEPEMAWLVLLFEITLGSFLFHRILDLRHELVRAYVVDIDHRPAAGSWFSLQYPLHWGYLPGLIPFELGSI